MLTPNPSIMRSERGIARSDIAHMIMCVDSGISPTKSQNVSWARGGLRIAAVGLHLHGMDQVRKLDGVLDEEHRDVVADQIPVAFLGVELDGEAAHVARRIDRARAARDRREAHEHLGLLADLGQDFGARCRLQRFGQLEIAVGARATRVHDPLRNALVVEVVDLLAQDEVFEQ